MKYPEYANHPQKQKTDFGSQKREWGNNYLMSTGFPLEVIKMFWNWTEMVVV